MKFRTPYEPELSPPRLSPAKPIVMLGSCFSDNIAAKMRESLWRAENPLGTLYNPFSISRALQLMLTPLGLEEKLAETLFESYGLWHSRMFDSRMSAVERGVSMKAMLEAASRLHSLLQDAGAMTVTFGTAKVWELAGEPGCVVGNCHKQPASEFTTRRLSVGEIADEWTRTIEMLREEFSGLPVIFTVSPVRYLKDGFAENARSKATLLLAVEEICRRLPDCFYFPAYEIYMDDLRDYRYYASDLIHPSDEGVEYVWDMFRKTYLGPEEEEILKTGREIVSRYHHRPNIPIRTVRQEENLRKWREDTVELWYKPFREAYPLTLPLE